MHILITDSGYENLSASVPIEGRSMRGMVFC